jgi:RNA polymerase sigma-54 factor
LAFKQDLKLNLTQKLSLSNEMLLSLELIQMPLLELKERIENEILENPALELDEKINDNNKDIEDIETSFFEDESYFDDSSSEKFNSGSSAESLDDESKRNYLESTIVYKNSLADHLIWQLHVQNLTEKQKEIGSTIISLINEDGFFLSKLEDVFTGDDLAAAGDVLEIIQLFDPPGIATTGVKEALLFQLESMGQDEINKDAYEIIKDHFDLMVSRKDNEIARLMKIDSERLKKAYEFLGTLNPYPGRIYSLNEPKYIIPDAFVYKRENSLVVDMNDHILPFVAINKYVEKLAKQKNDKKDKRYAEQRKYIKTKVNEANQFINLIKYRNNSLFKLVLVIVKEQEEFFNKGPKYLKPLTMKEIADIIGLSESTVSRLASSKYLQTEWGIHDIRYFFSNSIATNNMSGALKSAQSVKEMIKEIIANNKDEKISDQKITEILSNSGIKIARRTVSKYRKNLKILPSHQRKF